jgi:tripartite-type tricarboxylate transporter receptor subunit TctC
MQTRRKFLALLCLTAMASPAIADKYPSRPVKIIISLPAGSSPDVRTRIIAHELGRIWGLQVVVENRPGGGGIISVQAALSAPADGYTLPAAPGYIHHSSCAERKSFLRGQSRPGANRSHVHRGGDRGRIA